VWFDPTLEDMIAAAVKRRRDGHVGAVSDDKKKKKSPTGHVNQAARPRRAQTLAGPRSNSFSFTFTQSPGHHVEQAARHILC
jgi:hypothetical protein